MIQESVVAIVSEDSLGEILPIVHRSGLGHVSRVLRSDRNPIVDQLRRAGVPVTQSPDSLADCRCVVLIHAAARAPMASALLVRCGASTVWTITSLGEWVRIEDTILQQPSAPVHPPRAPQHIPGRDINQHVFRAEPVPDHAES